MNFSCSAQRNLGIFAQELGSLVAVSINAFCSDGDKGITGCGVSRAA
jgi:hypothetical protein